MVVRRMNILHRTNWRFWIFLLVAIPVVLRRSYMKHRAIFWSMMVFALCGCSKPSHPPAVISTADRVVVVTNRYHTLELTVSRDEAGGLSRAVAQSKQDRLPASAIFDRDLEFCAGTNILAVIHLQGQVFMLGDTEYSDDTGVLAAFYRKLEAEERPR